MKDLIKKEICNKLNLTTPIQDNLIRIQVKSKQNYKSEWEEAQFRAEYIHSEQ